MVVPFGVRSALSIGITFLSLNVASAIENTLEGWDHYKFGMTPDQVRAIPGRSWLRLETYPGSAGTPNELHFMISGEPVSFAELNFQLTTYYKKKGLVEITLKDSAKILDRSACEQAFQDLLRKSEARYGFFSPTDRPVKNQSSEAEWRILPGSTSKYLFTKMTAGSLVIGAERQFPSARVQVTMISEKSSCSGEIGLALFAD
jgi:hypothetical protein